MPNRSVDFLSTQRRSETKVVQIGGLFAWLVRLCRPAVRKGSGFPAKSAPFLLLRAVCPDESGQTARRRSVNGQGTTERQSHSAQRAAKPQFVPGQIEGNLDKLGRRPPLQPNAEIRCGWIRK